MELKQIRVVKVNTRFNKISVEIDSIERQTVNIRVTNFLRLSKISVWKELGYGLNIVNIDTTNLAKGSYTVTLSFIEGAPVEEVFVKK